jgi:hypothetical protein
VVGKKRIMRKQKQVDVPLSECLDDKNPLTVGEVLSDIPKEALAYKISLFHKWLPILSQLNDPETLTPENILNRVAPLSILKLAQLMMFSTSDKVQATCAKELAYMSGYKPVEKSQSINVNLMGRGEMTSLLESKLEKYGVKLISIDGGASEQLTAEDLVAYEKGELQKFVKANEQKSK